MKIRVHLLNNGGKRIVCDCGWTTWVTIDVDHHGIRDEHMRTVHNLVPVDHRHPNFD